MVGHVLGHYRILEQIGSGGMGEVYRAADDRLGREVAVKVLKPALAQDRDRLRRFEQEARAAAALNHPNIVSIFDIGIHDGAPYIVSELLQGETLRKRIAEGPLSTRVTTEFAVQIAQGLSAAHEKHIVHRDLKPENLFITRDNRIKILDFGIAKLTARETAENSSIETMTTQTKAGSILGTVAYMSPEQLRGKAVDHRSDIFSLGAILFEMLTGKRAFKGETEVDTMTAVLKEEPADPGQLGAGIPANLDQVVRHCLEKEPENRFQSARDVAFALGTVSTGDTVHYVRTVRSRSWRWPVILLVAACVAAVGAVLAYLLVPRSQPVYRRITFQRGTVYAARFSLDGRNVIYSAAWNGQPIQIYTTLENSLLVRPLEVQGANLIGLSRANELALSLHGTAGGRLEFEHATLARAPMVGGTPRELLQDVPWADWSPSGELAVVHHANSRDNLEFPIGRVLYSTTGAISHLRFSPKGDRIAFLDHPRRYEVRGSVAVVDLSGDRRQLTGDWQEEYGLAWAPGGNEVWFTAVEDGATERSLWAATLSRRLRKLLPAAQGLSIHDVASDGRALLSVDSERLGMAITTKDGSTRDLSWFEWSLPRALSADGQWLLFEESSPPTGPQNAVAIRKVDGSPPINLGSGQPIDLSPDGKWALTQSEGKSPHLTLLPVGTGQAREIAVPEFENFQINGGFLPDGKHAVIDANLPKHAGQTFMLDLSAPDKPHAVTPEGSYATIASPDGRFLVGGTTNQPFTIYPVQGGPSTTVAAPNGQVAFNWTADSKALLVYRPGEVPMKIYRMEVSSGRMSLLRTLAPPDRTGVVSIVPVVGNEVTSFAYGYYQDLSDLFIVTGLK